MQDNKSEREKRWTELQALLNEQQTTRQEKDKRQDTRAQECSPCLRTETGETVVIRGRQTHVCKTGMSHVRQTFCLWLWCVHAHATCTPSLCHSLVRECVPVDTTVCFVSRIFFRAALTSTHLRQLPAPCLCPEPGKLVKVGLRNAPSSLLCAVAAAVKQTGNRAWGLRESESKKEKVCVLLVQHCCRNRRHSQAISWFHQSCCRLRSMFH